MSYLARILELRRDDVDVAKAVRPLADVRAEMEDATPPRGFLAALERQEKRVALIAEIKAASPSRGRIRPDVDPARLAVEYQCAGADALSVLTENRFFEGSVENLVAARAATSLPILRKDFLFDPYQIYESRAMGADALLLIVAALEFSQLRDLQYLAFELGMDVLVEAHTPKEAEAAIEAGARLVGVNNRDLSTLEVDLAASEEILPILKGHAFLVSESGIESQEDVARVRAAGAGAVLIGTAFCGPMDVGMRVREVMGWW